MVFHGYQSSKHHVKISQIQKITLLDNFNVWQRSLK